MQSLDFTIVTGGHIPHGEHALDQMLVRPCPQCARYTTPIDGLYLCGSGSHPGGGLTGLRVSSPQPSS